MKFYKTILAATAVILPLSAGIGSALSYFTANTTAAGGYAVEVGEPQTEITESFDSWTKHVTITNTGEIPVYIRAKAFSGSQYGLTYSGDGWVDGKDGYYYYSTVLEVGKPTSSLDIKITGVPENATDKDAFNVVVIYERTPAVQYNEDGSVKLDGNGNPMPDWNYKVIQQNEFPVKPDTGSATKTPDVPTDENGTTTEPEGGECVMKKFRKFISSPKVTLAAFGAAIVLLLFSTIGGARAAIVDYSENHMTNIETQRIGVSLVEKTGDKKAVKNPEQLLSNLVGENEKVKTGQKYQESLSVQNSGEIDQYVRVTIYRYWVKKGENGTENKITNVYPGYIDLNLKPENGWVVDESASTQERTVIYYTGVLTPGASAEFADSLRIDPAVGTIVTKDGQGVSYDYQGLEFRIKVDVDAVQTHNAEDAILSAWGKNVTVGEDGSLGF